METAGGCVPCREASVDGSRPVVLGIGVVAQEVPEWKQQVGVFHVGKRVSVEGMRCCGGPGGARVEAAGAPGEGFVRRCRAFCVPLLPLASAQKNARVKQAAALLKQEAHRQPEGLRRCVADTLVVPSSSSQALGKAPTFGIRDNRSIKDQRESLPIFKLREQLIQAVHDNQVGAGSGGSFLG